MVKTEMVPCRSHVIAYMENIPQELFLPLASENKISKKKKLKKHAIELTLKV